VPARWVPVQRRIGLLQRGLSKRYLRQRHVFTARIHVQLERPMLHGARVQRRLLRHASSWRRRHVQPRSWRHDVHAVRRRQLLCSNRSVFVRRNVLGEHGLLPALHHQRDKPPGMPNAMLHEQRVQRVDDVRRDKLRRAVFLRLFSPSPRSRRGGEGARRYFPRIDTGPVDDDCPITCAIACASSAYTPT
jgi:hypothetical protein